MKYYITSDVHSFYTGLHQALEEVGYSTDPEPHHLIILGDLFDRGQEAVEMQRIILQLIEQSVVILISGNHEDLYEEMVTIDEGQPSRHYVSTDTSQGNHAKAWTTWCKHLCRRLYLWCKDHAQSSSYTAPARQTDYSNLPPAFIFIGTAEPFYAEAVTYVEKLWKLTQKRALMYTMADTTLLPDGTGNAGKQTGDPKSQ